MKIPRLKRSLQKNTLKSIRLIPKPKQSPRPPEKESSQRQFPGRPNFCSLAKLARPTRAAAHRVLAKTIRGIPRALAAIPAHASSGHSAPRRPQLISEMLKPGEEIVIQIAKEP